MKNDFKEIPVAKRRIDLLFSVGLGVLAAVVYGLTLSKGVYPGESARLMAIYGGFSPLELPSHPLWGAVVTWLSGLSVLTLPTTERV